MLGAADSEPGERGGGERRATGEHPGVRLRYAGDSEIALRHTSAKKNETDAAYDTPDLIPLRYVIAFVYPITATIKPFLANEGHNPDEVDKMHDAWFKSVVMQVALWAYPYTKEGEH